MKFHHIPVLCALSLSLALASTSAALADSITFTGTVTAGETREVYAPIGGKAESVQGEVGAKVKASDTLVSLTTTKVYAEEDGVVTGVFGQPGDSAETIANLYGCVVSIEGESVYSISASTDNAYNSTATKFVHVGESVTLSCYSDGNHTGTGVITSIEGTDYTVRVTSGEFLVGETVNVYRGESAVSSQRVGRGTLNRTSPIGATGTGSIVSIAVEPGDAVQRGDLLFETLDGTFDGLYMSGNTVPAGADGTISQINVQQGATVAKGDVLAVLYPEGAMRIEAQVEEANLPSIHEGDPVTIELLWNQDEEVSYPGVISGISAIADSTASEAAEEAAVTFTVYVDFTPDENTRYGMSAVVTTQDEEAEADGSAEEADSEAIEQAEAQPGEAEDVDRGEDHGAFDPDSRPDEFPQEGTEEVTDDARS